MMNELYGEIEFTMDIDSPGTFDQFSSFVTSPSPSDRPWSPLWSYSDNMPPAIANAGNPDSTTESQLHDGDTRRLHFNNLTILILKKCNFYKIIDNIQISYSTDKEYAQEILLESLSMAINKTFKHLKVVNLRRSKILEYPMTQISYSTDKEYALEILLDSLLMAINKIFKHLKVVNLRRSKILEYPMTQISYSTDKEYALEILLDSLLMAINKIFKHLKVVNLRSSKILEYPITQENPSNEDMAVFHAEHNEVALPCLDERVILTEEERDNEVRGQVPESSARNIVETTTILIPPITEISQNERQVDTVASKQNGDPKSSSQRVYRTGTLSSKDIEQHFGKKLEDAAKNLGVGVSTLKRACRANGIERWPSHKRNKVKSSPSNFNHKFDKHVGDGEPFSSNPRPMYTTGVADKPYHSPPRWVTVKATCGVDIIRFRLSTSSFTMADLLRNITQRLPLTEGSFKIKYEDDNGDWILIACDEDIEECIRLLNEENSIINMSLVPL